MTDFDAEDFEANLKIAVALLREAFEKSKYAKVSVSFQDGRVVHIGEEVSHPVVNRTKKLR